MNYLLGYCWYLHLDRQHSKQIEEEVERALLLTVRQAPDFAKAWLYLGHNAYDFKRYALAKERFSCIGTTALPPYLQLKADEMLLCCAIRLNGLSQCLDKMEQFIVVAERHEIQDIWPQELSKTLAEYLPTMPLAEYQRIKTLAHRLDNAGHFGNWFGEIVDGFTPS